MGVCTLAQMWLYRCFDDAVPAGTGAPPATGQIHNGWMAGQLAAATPWLTHEWLPEFRLKSYELLSLTSMDCSCDLNGGIARSRGKHRRAGASQVAEHSGLFDSTTHTICILCKNIWHVHQPWQHTCITVFRKLCSRHSMAWCVAVRGQEPRINTARTAVITATAGTPRQSTRGHSWHARRHKPSALGSPQAHTARKAGRKAQRRQPAT